MKTYTVCRRFSIDVERTITAETMAEAAQKAEDLGFNRWLCHAPGASINDWDSLSGTWITEKRE